LAPQQAKPVVRLLSLELLQHFRYNSITYLVVTSLLVVVAAALVMVAVAAVRVAAPEATVTTVLVLVLAGQLAVLEVTEVPAALVEQAGVAGVFCPV
jgi:hypothetical protein